MIEIINTVAELLGENPAEFASEFIEGDKVKEGFKDGLKAKVKTRLDEVYNKGKTEASSSIIPAEQYLAGVLKNAEELQETPKLDAKSLSDAVRRIQDAAVKKAVAELKGKLPNETELQKQYNDLLSENGKVTDEAKKLKELIETIKQEREEAIKKVKEEFALQIAIQDNNRKVQNALQNIINENVEVSNTDAHNLYSNVAIQHFMEMYDLKIDGGKLVAYEKGTNKLAQKDYRDINVVEEAKKSFLQPKYGFTPKKIGGTTPPNTNGNTSSQKNEYNFPKTYEAANKLLQELIGSPTKDPTKISALNAHIQKM